jgi:hypothetical protein
MAKARQHNEWFKLIVKRTCSCGQKKTDVYSWGEYIAARWNTIDYVCESCFPQIVNRLLSHAQDCGCEFNLIGYRGTILPAWLKLPENCPII